LYQKRSIEKEHNFYFIQNSDEKRIDSGKFLIQNVIVIFENKNKDVKLIKFHKKYIKNEFGQRINYEFGAISQKATMRVSSKDSIELGILFSIIEKFKKEIFDHTILWPEDDEIIIKNIEFNKDYYRIRFEGINSITYSSLIGQFKLYNKKNPERLRVEYRVNPYISVNELKQLLETGFIALDFKKYIDDKVSEMQGYMISSHKRLHDLIYVFIDKKNN